jgi:hypothetical protein
MGMVLTQQVSNHYQSFPFQSGLTELSSQSREGIQKNTHFHFRHREVIATVWLESTLLLIKLSDVTFEYICLNGYLPFMAICHVANLFLALWSTLPFGITCLKWPPVLYGH